MKYLQDYVEDKQTQLFRETGSFFAFSNEQFAEQYNKDKKYVAMGCGLYTEKEHVKKLINGLYEINKDGIKQDIEENGIERIVLRELGNYEAFYTYDIEDTLDALKDYGVNRKYVMSVFHKYRKEYTE